MWKKKVIVAVKYISSKLAIVELEVEKFECYVK